MAFVENVFYIYTIILFGLVLLGTSYLLVKRTVTRVKYLRNPIEHVSYPRLRKQCNKIPIRSCPSVFWCSIYNLFILLTIGFFLWATPCRNFLLKVTGAMLAPLILFAGLLPLKYSIWYALLRIPFHHLLFLHRWLALLIFILSWLHTIFYIVNYSLKSTQNLPYTTIIHMFVPIERFWGTLALISMSILILCSLPCIRRQHYNFFRYIHYLYIVFIIATAFHQTYFIPYATIWGIAWTVDHLNFLFYGCLPTYNAVFTARVSEDPVFGFVYISFEKGTRFQYVLGQHVYLNVPSISRLEWHPFTIVSKPDDPVVELGVREYGDFTRELFLLSLKNPHQQIHIRGPFGNFPDVSTYQEIFMIASGAGITPFIAMLDSQYADRMTLVWICKTYDAFLCYSIVTESVAYKKIYISQIDPDITASDVLLPDCVYTVQKCNIPHEFIKFINRRPSNVIDMRRVLVMGCGNSFLLDQVYKESVNRTCKSIQFDYFSEPFEF